MSFGDFHFLLMNLAICWMKSSVLLANWFLPWPCLTQQFRCLTLYCFSVWLAMFNSIINHFAQFSNKPSFFPPFCWWTPSGPLFSLLNRCAALASGEGDELFSQWQNEEGTSEGDRIHFLGGRGRCLGGGAVRSYEQSFPINLIGEEFGLLGIPKTVCSRKPLSRMKVEKLEKIPQGPNQAG